MPKTPEEREAAERRDMARDARRPPTRLVFAPEDPDYYKTALTAFDDARVATHEAAKTGDLATYRAAREQASKAYDASARASHRYCPTPFVLERA